MRRLTLSRVVAVHLPVALVVVYLVLAVVAVVVAVPHGRVQVRAVPAVSRVVRVDVAGSYATRVAVVHAAGAVGWFNTYGVPVSVYGLESVALCTWVP